MESLCYEKVNEQGAVRANHMDKGDLCHLEKFFQHKYGVRIAETTSGAWAIEIKFEGEAEVFGLESSRGVLKIWRNLSNAISFVKENCPNAGEVLVDVQGWRLMKLIEPGSLI